MIQYGIFDENNRVIAEFKTIEEGLEALKKLNDGEILGLPPDLSSTRIAPPGEYRLRSTGEVVVDPDYLTTWNINRSKEEMRY